MRSCKESPDVQAQTKRQTDKWMDRICPPCVWLNMQMCASDDINVKSGETAPCGSVENMMEVIITFPPRSTPGGQLKHADGGPDKTVCSRLLCLLIVRDDIIEHFDQAKAFYMVIWLAVAATSWPPVGQDLVLLGQDRLTFLCL